jgi:hypothetical protein
LKESLPFVKDPLRTRCVLCTTVISRWRPTDAPCATTAVVADGDKAACHSDYIPADEAQRIQEERLVQIGTESQPQA